MLATSISLRKILFELLEKSFLNKPPSVLYLTDTSRSVCVYIYIYILLMFYTYKTYIFYIYILHTYYIYIFKQIKSRKIRRETEEEVYALGLM